MSSNFIPTKLTENVLTEKEIDNGRLYITTDTRRLYVDLDDTRLFIESNIYLDTDSQRLMLLAPLSNKLYIVKETGKIWIFTNTWVELCNNSGGSGGTNDYLQLINKPQINSTELEGNKSLIDLGIQSINDDTLTTTEKTVVGAINELKNNLENIVGDIDSLLDEINGEII